MLGRLYQRLVAVWRLALAERSSPRDIGWAVAIGAFAGCTPAVGFHSAVALGLATLFKKNRIFAWLGSRVSNVAFLPFIVFAEVQVAHRFRTGTWLALGRHQVFDHARTLLLDWCLGAVPVGALVALVLGTLSWAIALRRDRRLRRDGALGRGAAT